MTMLTTIDAMPSRLRPARAASTMLYGIAGFAALMIGWAALATVPETAIATGRVVPQRQLQVIGNQEGGVVAAILVRPGQHVAAGQLLLRLDPGAAGADFGRSSAAVNALAARIARLEGEATDRVPVFPAELETAAPGAVAAERALWSARQIELNAAAAGETARAEGAARGLAEAVADRQSRSEARAQAEREAMMIAPLVDKGIEPAIGLQRARSQQAQATSAEYGATAGVARANAALAGARAALRGVEGKYRTQSVDQLAAARAELAGQNAGLPTLQRRVERADIRSPVAGIVQRVLATTIGGSAAPGAPLVEIVPAGDALVVEAEVRPADIAFVHIGQRARVKLTAYDASVYGGLDGRVERISPDALTDPRGGESRYQVRIVTAKSQLKAPDGMMLPIGVGMVTQVDLVGRQRSVLSYLLGPVTKLSENAFRER